jgi:hypothetical protein
MLQKTIMSTSGNVLGLILAAVAVIAMLLGVTMTQVWQHYHVHVYPCHGSKSSMQNDECMREE